MSETDGTRAARSLVVVGASAGGVAAVQAFLESLAPGLPAAVGVVVHRPAVEERGRLARVFGARSVWPVSTVEDGEPILEGRVALCRAGAHLAPEAGRWRYSAAPRENNVRPSIDVLFRGAAGAFGRRAVGVLLSGVLDDGVDGLRAIKAAGGAAVVQRLDEALFDDMPRAAIESVDVDAVARIAEMSGVLAELLRRREADPVGGVDLAPPPADPSLFSCPACGGVLSEERGRAEHHYVCRIGHAYSARTLLISQNDALEAALGTALRTLVEKRDLSERLADRARSRGAEAAAAGFDREARAAGRDAEVLGRVFRKPEDAPFRALLEGTDPDR